MKCSRKSTTWCVEAVLALGCAVAPVMAQRASPDAAREDAVRAAIVDAVGGRLGEGVVVRVEGLRVTGTLPAGPIVAVPEASARSGRPVVFALSAADQSGTRRRVAGAVATVRLEGPCYRAARSLVRGERLGGGDLAQSRGALDDVPLRPLPGQDSLLGATLARDVAAGDVLTGLVVRAAPLVRSGDDVTVRARVGGVEAQARAIASQTGGAGAVIQVVNPETRRMLKGRVVARGEVEVIHDTK